MNEDESIEVIEWESNEYELKGYMMTDRVYESRIDESGNIQIVEYDWVEYEILGYTDDKILY